jgi:beta-lactam-binding protein with PASTA domain
LQVTGFKIGPDRQVFNAEVDSGTVLGTDPPEGLPVPEGSPVSLVVASSLTVPAVRWESVERATRDLVEAGFTVTTTQPTFDSDVDPGAVVGTTPAAGTRVDPTTPQIALAVSNAVVVPDVTRGNVGQARDQLSPLGLSLKVSAMFGASGASVISQVPLAGTRVEPGSTVLVSAFP